MKKTHQVGRKLPQSCGWDNCRGLERIFIQHDVGLTETARHLALRVQVGERLPIIHFGRSVRFQLSEHRGGEPAVLRPAHVVRNPSCTGPRNGRTELAVAGAAISGRGDDYAISYRINSDGPVQTAAGAPLFGTGAAFKGDIVRLLQSLPEEGNMAIRLAPRTGAVREGNFSLGGLKLVRDKLAAACKWPQAVAKPRD